MVWITATPATKSRATGSQGMVESSPVSAVLLSSVTGAGESALAAELRESVGPRVDVSAAGRDKAASVPDSGANAPLTRA